MRKLIDEKGRLFGFISIVDIIVIAVAAVLAAVVLLRTSEGETPASTVKTIPVTYTADIYNIREATTKIIRPGDKVYTNTGIYIGTIKSVDINDAWVTVPLLDGVYTKARSHERYDVTLVVEAQCSVASGRYYADRTYELCANTEQKIVTKYLDTTCTIMDITVIDAESPVN